MYRKIWIQTTVLFLLIATFLGGFLRYMMFNPVEGLDFKNLLHTHSHVAFMGWIFNALFIGLIYSFIPKDFKGAKRYRYLFWAFQLSVLGMLFSFPVQGYGAVSIAFSTLHIVLSVVLAVFFVRDTKVLFPSLGTKTKPLSLAFALAGIFFLLLSSFGPFALGYGMAKEMGDSFNKLAIYFYLHFQYDGWFTFAIFALFYRMLERENIPYLRKPARIFFLLLLFSCIPAYAGSTLWTHPADWVYVAGVLAALAQVAGLWYFVNSVKHQLNQIKAGLSRWSWFLFLFAFGCFVFKSVLQLAGTIPFVADMAHQFRNFLIFHLHVIFLGFVSVFLFAWFEKQRLFSLRPLFGIVFLAGFIISQLLIVAQPLLLLLSGYVIPYYHWTLFYISLLMPGALLVNVVIEGLSAKEPGNVALRNTRVQYEG